jgi:hypothetical protein
MEYLNTLAEGESEWRETLQGAPKHLSEGRSFTLYIISSLIVTPSLLLYYRASGN